MLITEQLSEFISTLRNTNIPEQAIEVARLGFIDCVGVMVAGSAESAPHIVAKTLHENNGKEGCRDVVLGKFFQHQDAALINGVAAHVLDYDDVALEGHPSSVLVPAIISEAVTNNSSGLDMLKAYIAGYETWAFINHLDPGSYHDRGFHPTSVCGTLAAAASCSYLKNLPKKKIEHAIGISASMASGLVANFGTMTKSLHVGLAAKNGVYSADLASFGYTASLDVLEHRTGFLSAHSPSTIDSNSLNINYKIGEEWKILDYGINIKRYPVCYATHRSIDAILNLLSVNKFELSEIDSISVLIGTVQKLMLRNDNPQNSLEAKFSMQFAIAAALVSGRVGLSELKDSFVKRHDVQNYMQLIHVDSTDERVVDWDQPYSPYDMVTVRLKNGKVLSQKVERPKGSWENQLSKSELYEKFNECTSRVVDSTKLFDVLWDIESLSSVDSIIDMITPIH